MMENWTIQDKQVLGNTIPKITYGISAGLRYKGFDLSLLFQGLGKANVFTQNEMTRLGYEYMRIAGLERRMDTGEFRF